MGKPHFKSLPSYDVHWTTLDQITVYLMAKGKLDWNISKGKANGRWALNNRIFVASVVFLLPSVLQQIACSVEYLHGILVAINNYGEDHW